MTSNGNGNNDSNSNSSSKSPTALTSPAEPAVAAHSPGGPVIGVGASAGGLQALEEFFSQVQPDCGMAFVVVQHLDPDKQSLLAELLQRVSQLPVEQLAFSTPVEVNHVYVAPPAHDVELRQGLLHLLKPQVTRGKRLPIDFFLNSLAEDQQANAAGVILSGMGVDGTLGLRALKEKGGGVFVQSPDKAEFAGMPASAVDARLADVVAPAGELPARIADHFQNMLASNLAAGTQADLHAGIAKVLILVRTLTGHDFSYYKKSTVYRRIQRRMAIHQIQSLDEYARHIQLNPIEAQLLFKELLIGVTSFFRDPEVWRQLASQHIPELIRTHPDGAVLRAWVAACSTGEEAYTLAIIFAEVLAELRPQAHYSLQIFATDMDKDAIDKARLGQYSPSAVSELSEERLNRFFTKVPGGYQVRKDIRAMVIFAQQSIASDPPFARLDILCCRNLLIYLESDLQQKLLQLFHGSLNPGGLLVLGSAETVGQASALFSALGTKTRIYRRRGAGGRLGLGGLPRQSGFAGVSLAQAQILPTADPAGASLQGLADQLLLRKFAPSAVFVTAQGDIVYFSGKTGKYLEPPAGKANFNLFAMARPGLSQPLTELFYRAIRQKTIEKIENITLDEGGHPLTLSVVVEPLEAPKALAGMLMVVFIDTLPPESGQAGPLAGDARVVELMHELALAREEHQATREEMQSSQEELKSANEELQSANEELTTSREEMQSMNEELQTVNADLHARVDALARASDDMDNLLNSTDIATLFLDGSLHVRRFTDRASGVIKLIPSDIGRPITDLVSDLDYATLASDAAEVLRTLIFKEKEVSASGERSFRVRIMPYRTQDNRIDGVVITFTQVGGPRPPSPV